MVNGLDFFEFILIQGISFNIMKEWVEIIKKEKNKMGPPPV